MAGLSDGLEAIALPMNMNSGAMRGRSSRPGGTFNLALVPISPVTALDEYLLSTQALIMQKVLPKIW